MKYWETIADNLSKTGWSWGCVSALDAQGRTIWIVDAHGDGKRFIVRADEILTAYLGTGKRDSSRELSKLASYKIGFSNRTCAAKQPRLSELLSPPGPATAGTKGNQW